MLLRSMCAGLVAGAATDLLLVALGAGQISGVQVGVLAAPLLLATLLRGRGVDLVVLGAAWTLAPLIDQHLTAVVTVDGAFPDLLHHVAGWPALVAGAVLQHKAIPST